MVCSNTRLEREGKVRGIQAVLQSGPLFYRKRNFTNHSFSVFAEVYYTCMYPTQPGLNVTKKKPERDVTFRTMNSVWVPTILILQGHSFVDMLPWQQKDVQCLPVEDDVRIYCTSVNERE